MIKRLHVLMILLQLVVAGSVSYGGLVVQQTFNGLSTAGRATTDNLSSGQQLTNSGSTHDGVSNGHGFDTFWFSNANGGATGPTNGATQIVHGVHGGINPFGGADGPVTGGSGGPAATDHYFFVEDPDGRSDLIFDPVNISGVSDAVVSLQYWVSSTSWEAPDFLNVGVTDGTNTASLLSLSGTAALDGVESSEAAPTWHTLNTNLFTAANGGGLNLANVSVFVQFSSNSTSEEFGIDNFQITGTAVPEPSAFLCLGFVLLAAGGYRFFKSSKNKHSGL